MRIAVIGRNGQLALCIASQAQQVAGMEIITIGRPEFDLLEASSIHRLLDAVQPDVVILAAAYTNVDRAEYEPDIAFAINCSGPRVVAEASAKSKIPIIYISTDHVFSGDKESAYTEACETKPVNIYGASKRAGELVVAEANPRHLILRTSWLYSHFGNNFVKNILKYSAEKSLIDVVGDQWGNPTSAMELAHCILLFAKLTPYLNSHQWGNYHVAGKHMASRAEFARKILSLTRQISQRVNRHCESPKIRAISSTHLQEKARRPQNSFLSISKYQELLGYEMPHWHQSAEVVVRTVLAVN